MNTQLKNDIQMIIDEGLADELYQDSIYLDLHVLEGIFPDETQVGIVDALVDLGYNALFYSSDNGHPTIISRAAIYNNGNVILVVYNKDDNYWYHKDVYIAYTTKGIVTVIDETIWNACFQHGHEILYT